MNNELFFHDLESERLLLKNISYEDRDFIFKQFSDADVTKYLLDEEPCTTMQEADDIIDCYLIPEPRLQHRWILTLKSDNSKIGTCGFHCWNRENWSVEIGYDMQKEYWDKGYMTEALSAIILFAKQDMQVKRIDAHIYPDNVRSSKLVKKLGFMNSADNVIYAFRGIDYIHNIYQLEI
ncbi:MAG TPA: GNAT family N-acetyltransferase [Lachnospiraceae bacterium]|nr:GNAT family N-acetyltransferase [Lachnospiraceae bacterium]